MSCLAVSCEDFNFGSLGLFFLLYFAHFDASFSWVECFLCCRLPCVFIALIFMVFGSRCCCRGCSWSCRYYCCCWCCCFCFTLRMPQSNKVNWISQIISILNPVSKSAQAMPPQPLPISGPSSAVARTTFVLVTAVVLAKVASFSRIKLFCKVCWDLFGDSTCNCFCFLNSFSLCCYCSCRVLVFWRWILFAFASNSTAVVNVNKDSKFNWNLV